MSWLRFSIVVLMMCKVNAQANPRFIFSVDGPCGKTIVGPPGGTYDDGTGGVPYFTTWAGDEFVPRMRPGQTWEVVLSTEENRSESGVFSWAFGVGFEGGIEITDITTDGTAGCYVNRPFPECRARFHSEARLTGPPNGIGPQTEENRGGISFVRLNLDGVEQLPPAGSIAVCKIRVSGKFPKTDGETTTGRLLFAARFKAPDWAIPPAVYWGGGTGEPITVDRGDPPLQVQECVITLKASSVAPFIRCDPNDDGRLSIADAVWILNELFVGGARTRCPISADCNADGERNIADAVFGLTHLFLGGPAPAAPYPSCGRIDVPVEECPPQSTSCP